MSSALLCTALLAAPLFAHEFWIAPDTYQLPAGGTITATFKNGENFEGIDLAYFDRRSARLDVVNAQGIRPLTPRNGDDPAIVLTAAPEGLLVIAHETTASRLTYRDWQKFLKFAARKDFPDAPAIHNARGWSPDMFRETYTRHVKALIGVGAGGGADLALGLETEFVALTNPYAANFMQNMKINLLHSGLPRRDAQIEVFEKAPNGTVSLTQTRTGSDGTASFPTKPGHSYLLDAVILREAGPDTAEDVVWETLWAALTFAVPAAQ